MPKTKKKLETSDSDSGPDDKNTSPPSKKKSKDNGGGSASGSKADAPNTWTLEKLRQVRINEFRGRKSVDVREFYEKNGEILPGKKGISLTPAQWHKLLEVAEEVTKALGSE